MLKARETVSVNLSAIKSPLVIYYNNIDLKTGKTTSLADPLKLMTDYKQTIEWLHFIQKGYWDEELSLDCTVCNVIE